MARLSPILLLAVDGTNAPEFDTSFAVTLTSANSCLPASPDTFRSA